MAFERFPIRPKPKSLVEYENKINLKKKILEPPKPPEMRIIKEAGDIKPSLLLCQIGAVLFLITLPLSIHGLLELIK